MKPEMMPGFSYSNTTYVVFSVAVGILAKFNSDIKFMVDATGVVSAELLRIYFSTRDLVNKISKGYFEKPKQAERIVTKKRVSMPSIKRRTSEIT